MSEIVDEQDPGNATIFTGSRLLPNQLPVVRYDGRDTSTDEMATVVQLNQNLQNEQTVVRISSESMHGEGEARLIPGDRILNGAYVIEKSLRSGNEAHAYLGSDAFNPGSKVFVKYFKPQRISPEYLNKKSSLRERLLGLVHPNCMRMIGMHPTEVSLIEIYEFIEGQTLGAFLKKTPRPPDAFIREALQQISAGIQYFQTSLQLAHRDIKPDNIMIVQGETPRFIITDYGTVSAVDHGGFTQTEYTTYYAPPEAIRRTLSRDEDLYTFDWWSLGRIIQEMADGMHVSQKIRANLSGDDQDSASLAHVFESIMCEHERHVYQVRAGMVEWSDPTWRQPLRGLLTSKRQLRWRYAQIQEWYQGRQVADAYDAPFDIAPFRYLGMDYDPANAARVLAQAEHWDQAVSWIVEGRGIVDYIRNMGNQRFATKVHLTTKIYQQLEKFGTDIAEDLTTALTLSVISGEQAMPLTIRGKVVNQATLETAVKTKNAQLLQALLDNSFLEHLAALHGAEQTSLFKLLKQLQMSRDLLTRWTKVSSLPRASLCTIVENTLAAEEWRLKTYRKYTRDLAGTRDDEINRIFQNYSEVSCAEQVALLSGLALNIEELGFMTHIQAQADEVRRLKEKMQLLRLNTALASLTFLAKINDLLHGPSLTSVSILMAAGVSAVSYNGVRNCAEIVWYFLLQSIVMLILLVVARTFLSKLTRFYALRTLNFRATPTSVQVRVAWREMRGRMHLIEFFDTTRKVLPRAIELAVRHPELRLNPFPLPLFSGIIALAVSLGLATIPVGMLHVALFWTDLHASKISDRAFAERITAAYIHGTMRASDPFVEGSAREYLENRLRLGNYSKSMQNFGRFLEIRREREFFPLPGHSSFLVHFERCTFVESLARNRTKITWFLFSSWRPSVVNGCNGRETSRL